MNEENNVNQETEEKKEFEEKSKKMDEIFADTGEMILKDVSKIAGRDLTDAEKESVLNSLKSYFLITSLMLKALV